MTHRLIKTILRSKHFFQFAKHVLLLLSSNVFGSKNLRGSMEGCYRKIFSSPLAHSKIEQINRNFVCAEKIIRQLDSELPIGSKFL